MFMSDIIIDMDKNEIKSKLSKLYKIYLIGNFTNIFKYRLLGAMEILLVNLNYLPFYGEFPCLYKTKVSKYTFKASKISYEDIIIKYTKVAIHE